MTRNPHISYWTSHYESLGLLFPSAPVNGAIWGLWSLLFAIAIYVISRRSSLLETALLSWFVGFVLMWVVIWNLNVLPQDPCSSPCPSVCLRRSWQLGLP
ncbi:MAG: hypothetical protein JXC32_08650 [Anaerolineae bacterium]|nr:hypothetical protein [Anaerolineae bacterium]